jgi:hypothetical protein
MDLMVLNVDLAHPTMKEMVNDVSKSEDIVNLIHVIQECHAMKEMEDIDVVLAPEGWMEMERDVSKSEDIVIPTHVSMEFNVMREMEDLDVVLVHLIMKEMDKDALKKLDLVMETHAIQADNVTREEIVTSVSVGVVTRVRGGDASLSVVIVTHIHVTREFNVMRHQALLDVVLVQGTLKEMVNDAQRSENFANQIHAIQVVNVMRDLEAMSVFAVEDMKEMDVDVGSAEGVTLIHAIQVLPLMSLNLENLLISRPYK